MHTVFATGRRIGGSDQAPSVQEAFNFGHEYGKWQNLLRVNAAVSATWLILGILLFTIVNGQKIGGGIFVAASVLLGGGVGYGMSRLMKAKESAKRHLPCNESGPWNVCQLARDIQSEANPEIEKVREFGRQYGLLRNFTFLLAVTCFVLSILGILSASQVLLSTGFYPTAFACAGVSFISCVWISRKLNEAKQTIGDKFHFFYEPSELCERFASFIWRRC